MHPIMLRQMPDSRLLPWVSHYWFSAGGAARHVLLPDGCVDAVIAIRDSDAGICLYGTATRRTTLITASEARYLGVRFLPGQARHFLDMSAAELTDHAESVRGRDAFGLEAGQWLTGEPGQLFRQLDALLLAALVRRPPARLPLDNLLPYLHRARPNAMVSLVGASGLSRRQLERQCLTHVGVSPARFAMICRCHRVLAALSRSTYRPAPRLFSLAALAAAAGYADQSHMTRELRRFTGLTPGALLRDGVGEDVAFVLSGENAGL